MGLKKHRKEVKSLWILGFKEREEKIMSFREIKIEELQMNPFTKIGNEWMLVTAGNKEKHNTMTASWGGLGVLWKKNVVTIYIRPQRYTKEFIDHNDTFTLSFYSEEYKNALTILGRKSGRDGNKEKEAGLTPYEIDGTTGFEEAEMIFVCKKQYHQELKPECFDVKENDRTCYPDKDYHMMYIGEIEKVLVKDHRN